jgi:hypothetical protein
MEDTAVALEKPPPVERLDDEPSHGHAAAPVSGLAVEGQLKYPARDRIIYGRRSAASMILRYRYGSVRSCRLCPDTSPSGEAMQPDRGDQEEDATQGRVAGDPGE